MLKVAGNHVPLDFIITGEECVKMSQCEHRYVCVRKAREAGGDMSYSSADTPVVSITSEGNST